MTQKFLIPDNGKRRSANFHDEQTDTDELADISGTVERITFRNDENGYTVARFMIDTVRDGKHIEHSEVPGSAGYYENQKRGIGEGFGHFPGGIVTIVGRFPSINEGEHLTLSGLWVEHQKFGMQFDVKSSRMSAPATLKGMKKYLGSGLIPGIGPKLAERIVNHFKDDVFDIIENEPERLREVNKVGAKKAKNLAEAFKKQKAIRELMIFLQDHDVSPSIAVKVYKEYGDDAIRVLNDNPYTLADDLFGVGFRTADVVARKLGMEKDDPRRYRAGVRYILIEASNDGHVYYPREELLRVGEELLEADVESLDAAVKNLVDSNKVVDDHGRVYLKFLHEAEGQIAKFMGKLGKGKVKDYKRDALKARIDKIQQVEKISLASEQMLSVVKAYENQCLVITGGPGTGKSTTINVIVRLFEQLGKNVRLASPTGRAAKRLEEACGRPASTIHRLLEYHPRQGFGRNQDVQLDCKVLVVDEASMMDIPLMYHLLRAVPGNARLILVGDIDQLPSVGPGNVLRDIIDSGTVPVIELTEIFRQAAGSLIVTNAHRINQGDGPTFDVQDNEKDFRWFKEEDKNVIGDRVIEAIQEKLIKKFDPMREIQVLTPMHGGPCGARELNRRLQETCNPPKDGREELLLGDRMFRVNDRVMQIKNNYDLEVFNGDIGRILDINGRDGTMRVRYDRDVTYKRSDLDQLVLAYAITVHKSQGSEYPCVVIPLTTGHWIMLQRNLIYTAITRAKKYCVIVGQRKALWRAIKNANIAERYTNLMTRLREMQDKDGE